jgi:hypothetical protein
MFAAGKKLSCDLHLFFGGRGPDYAFAKIFSASDVRDIPGKMLSCHP